MAVRDSINDHAPRAVELPPPVTVEDAERIVERIGAPFDCSPQELADDLNRIIRQCVIDTALAAHEPTRRRWHRKPVLSAKRLKAIIGRSETKIRRANGPRRGRYKELFDARRICGTGREVARIAELLDAHEREALGVPDEGTVDARKVRRKARALLRVHGDDGGRPEAWVKRNFVLRLAAIYKKRTGRRAGVSGFGISIDKPGRFAAFVMMVDEIVPDDIIAPGNVKSPIKSPDNVIRNILRDGPAPD